jgi:hypothetical protein
LIGGNVEISELMSNELTTKAGTACPSTRQGAGSPSENVNKYRPPQTAGSIVNYASLNKSTNFASAVPSHNPSPGRYGTANTPLGKRVSTITSSGGLTVSNNYLNGMTHTRFPSQDTVKFPGDSQNIWLIKKQREEVQEFKVF